MFCEKTGVFPESATSFYFVAEGRESISHTERLVFVRDKVPELQSCYYQEKVQIFVCIDEVNEIMLGCVMKSEVQKHVIHGAESEFSSEALRTNTASSRT